MWEFILEMIKIMDPNARVGGGGNSVVGDDVVVDGNSNP